jgi:hypothetical protein
MLQMQYMARISAQETMPGQALSNAVFMSSTSTTPKPLTEYKMLESAVHCMMILQTKMPRIGQSQYSKKKKKKKKTSFSVNKNGLDV